MNVRIPSWQELADDVHVLRLPLATPFRGLNWRETVVFRGSVGWTEFAPFVEYDDDEASLWLRAAIEFGWEDLGPHPEQVRVNATVPAVSPGDVPNVLSRFPGARTVKVKVASIQASGSVAELDDDLERVRAVRAYLDQNAGPDARIRMDANGAWTVDQAAAAIEAVRELNVEYIEQPCATVDQLVELRGRVADSGVLIAADESVRRASDPLAVAKANAADLLVIKAAPLGGVTAAESIIRQAGLPVVVSSALESSIGLGMGAALAARLAAQGNVADAGLGTAELFTHDVCSPRRAVQDGYISTARFTPQAERLVSLAAPADRRDFWMSRLERCHTLLTSA